MGRCAQPAAGRVGPAAGAARPGAPCAGRRLWSRGRRRVCRGPRVRHRRLRRGEQRDPGGAAALPRLRRAVCGSRPAGAAAWVAAGLRAGGRGAHAPGAPGPAPAAGHHPGWAHGAPWRDADRHRAGRRRERRASPPVAAHPRRGRGLHHERPSPGADRRRPRRAGTAGAPLEGRVCPSGWPGFAEPGGASGPARQGVRGGVCVHGRQPAAGGQAAATPPPAPGASGLPAGPGWRRGPAPGRPGRRSRATRLGVLPHAHVDDVVGGDGARRGALRRGRSVRRPGGRGTGLIRRRAGDLRHLRRPRSPAGEAAVLRPHREGAAGRGHEPALPAGQRVEPSAAAPRGAARPGTTGT